MRTNRDVHISLLRDLNRYRSRYCMKTGRDERCHVALTYGTAAVALICFRCSGRRLSILLVRRALFRLLHASKAAKFPATRTACLGGRSSTRSQKQGSYVRIIQFVSHFIDTHRVNSPELQMMSLQRTNTASALVINNHEDRAPW